MTYTKQHGCIAFIDERKNIEKPKITEKQGPQNILLDSLEKLYAELDDFEKVGNQYLKDIGIKLEKLERGQ